MASSIKVSYGGEMRRFAALTYEDLQLRVMQLFNVRSFLLKYKDEDGDMVTVSSGFELEEALRSQGPVLRLNIEIVDDPQSEDYILVHQECVMHMQERVQEVELPPSPEPSPMAVSPMSREPEQQPEQPEQEERCRPSEVRGKRTYAEATESKEPYATGTQKQLTYVISIPADVNRRPTKATSVGPAYAQEMGTKAPYAAGMQGQEFLQTPSAKAPYAQGMVSGHGFVQVAKAVTPYISPVLSAKSAPYASRQHAQVPFTHAS